MSNHTHNPIQDATNKKFYLKIKGLTAIILAGALVGGTTTAQAGLWDTVKSTASSVRQSAPTPVENPVQPIRNKAEELLQRAAETQSTVNAMIAETDVIKRRLEPVSEAFETVRGMKERFDALQFNPAEMLDSPELQDALEMLKERRRIARERLNDPHLESFRGEFLDTLAGLRGLVADEIGLAPRERSPLETLVENAPRTVMVLIKAAAKTGFGKLQTGTRQLTGDIEELRRLNVLGDLNAESDLCRAHKLASESVYFKALRAKKKLVAVSTALKLIANRIPAKPIRFGVHGYADLIEIDPGKNAKDRIGTILIALEGLGARLDLVRETATHYSAPGACAR